MNNCLRYMARAKRKKRGGGWRRILAAAPLLLTAGCVGPDGFYGEIREARTRAYEEWRLARAREKQSEVKLTGKLSLRDAVRLSLLHNKTLQATLQGKEIAAARKKGSRAGLLPTVSATGAYTRLDESSIAFPFRNTYSVDLQVKQPIYRGGATLSEIRAARLSAHIADETIRGQVQQTIYDVGLAYFDVLLAQQLYAANQEAVTSAQAHLDEVKHKRAQEMASLFDLLRAQVDVSNFTAEMIQQRNRIHTAKTRLLKAMGVLQESDVTLADKLEYIPAKPAFEEAARIAFENRADLFQAELGVRLQEESLKLAASSFRPQLGAFFTQGVARPDPHDGTDDDWGEAWRAGATVEWLIFDGLGREGRLDEEKATLKKKHIELLDAQERTLLMIRQAILSLADAEEFVASQKLNVTRAREGLRLAEAGYREEVNSRIDVADARSALTQALGLYYQALYNHTVARLALNHGIGTLGPKAGENAAWQERFGRPARLDVFVPAGRGRAGPPRDTESKALYPEQEGKQK